MVAHTRTVLFFFLLLCSPTLAGPLCFAICYAAVIGTGAVSISAILPLLGFTSGGVAAGSFAAWWMGQIGAVAAGSLFATLQSLGASASYSSVYTASIAICTPLCVAIP